MLAHVHLKRTIIIFDGKNIAASQDWNYTARNVFLHIMRHLCTIQKYTWLSQWVLWQTAAPISWTEQIFLHINTTFSAFYYPLFSFLSKGNVRLYLTFWSSKNSFIDYSHNVWWKNLVAIVREGWTGALGVMTGLLLLASLTTGKRAGNYAPRRYMSETQ